MLKEIFDFIPYLAPYPLWVKALISFWLLLTAVTLIIMLLAPRAPVVPVATGGQEPVKTVATPQSPAPPAPQRGSSRPRAKGPPPSKHGQTASVSGSPSTTIYQAARDVIVNAPEQAQPKPLEEVRVSMEGISSPFPEARYGLALTLQSTVPISPIHFVVECDEIIHQASFRFSGMASMMAGVSETLAANKYEFYAQSPPFTPQTPLIVSLFSRKPIRLRSVTRLY